MKFLKTFFTIALALSFLTTDAFAVSNNCKNAKYRRLHPEDCEKTYNNSATIALLGGAALVGIGVALANQTSSDSIPSSQITNQSNFPRSSNIDYSLADYVQNQKANDNYIDSLTHGTDIDDYTLQQIRLSDKYIKNFSQYESINFAWSVARGLSGKNVNIAVMDDFYSYHGYAVSDIAKDIATKSTVTTYKVTNGYNNFISYDSIANVYAQTHGQQIYNNSWQIIATSDKNAATAIYNGNTPKTYAEAQEYLTNTTSYNFISEIINHAINDDSIFVWAAGNESSTESGVLSAIPVAFPEMQGHFVNVVAFDTSTNNIAWFSNQCGITQNYCISAPGSLIKADSAEHRLNGTSFATPIVSGAIAIIKEAFPYMNSSEITQLLFTTAQDIGAPGIDSVFGWGLLDMEKATKPVGTPKIVLSENNIQPLRTATVSGIAATSIKKSKVKLAFVDDFGRSFNTNLSDNIKIVNRGQLLEKIKEDDNNSFVFDNGLEFGIKQSNILESNGLLSVKNTNFMNFVGYKNEFSVNNIKFYQSTRFGFTLPLADENSLISSISDIYTATIKFGIKFDDFDFGIAIPDTIIAGNMYLNTPVGRANNGEMIYQKSKINLISTPSTEFNIKYKSFQIGYIQNHDIKDEFYIMAKTKFMF